MEAYSLADAPPPRYAVESDDEDEYNPLSPPTSSDHAIPEIKVEFKSIYDIPSKRPLIFASGAAGVSWAKLVHLGEQQAGIYVNNLAAGLLFCPPWTTAVVVISETEGCTQLPLFATTAYTTAIVDRLQPTRVAILDSYPTRFYTSTQATMQDDVRIRYISVRKKSCPESELELFAPPNLLQSTAASLLNELFLSGDSTQDSITIILLPSSKLTVPSPMIFHGKETCDISSTNWDREMLEKANKLLLTIIGEEVDESSLLPIWSDAGKVVSTEIVKHVTLGQVGEGSMYI